MRRCGLDEGGIETWPDFRSPQDHAGVGHGGKGEAGQKE